MEINNTSVVNGADGTSFNLPGSWDAAMIQTNYSQFSGMRASVTEADGTRTITFAPITGAKG